MNPSLDYAKLGRFLANECPAAEAAEVRAWLAADPAHREAFAVLERLWRGSQGRAPEWNEDAVWAKLAARLEDPKQQRTRSWFVPRARFPWLAAAAAAAVLLLGSTLVVSRMTQQDGPVALREVATVRAQRAQLRLADGTRITLSVESRLRYSPTLRTDATRDVYLDGEAYFEVASDSLRPFRVHAGNAVTRVLGTRFGVRAYAEDGGVRVVVVEGRVAFERDSTAGVVLSRGDLGEIRGGAAPAVRHDVDVSGHLAWVDGRLAFADTPLREVVLRLSRWYDLDIRLDPSLAHDPFTMSLRGDEAPERVLRILAAAVGARVERRDTTYVIVRGATEVP